MVDVAGVAKDLVRALDTRDYEIVRGQLRAEVPDAQIDGFLDQFWTPAVDDLAGSGRVVLEDVVLVGDPPVAKVRIEGERGTTTVALGFDGEGHYVGYVIEPPTHGIRNLVIGAPFVGYRELGLFYAELLGMRIIREDWLMIARDRRTEPYVAFGDGWSETRPVRWPDPQFPQQLHLDLAVADLDAAHQAVVAQGATLLQDRGSFRTFADPVGHPFCLYADGSGSDRDIARIVFDGPDPAALADFYASLLSMPERIEDTADRVVISRSDGVGPQLGFQRSDSIPADYPDPDRPAMLHLDLYFDDGRAATERAQSLGARPLQRPGTPPGAPPSVFADPAGHPFCIMHPHRP